MMKSRLLLFVVLTFMGIAVSAREIDGINYYLNFSSHTAVVQRMGAGSENYSGDIVIPASVSYNGEDYAVTRIDQAAFSYCEGVTSIALPNTLTTIGNSAFEGTAITSVTIPASVTTIGEKAVGNCRQLAAIIVEEGNSMFDSRENCNALIETASNTLLQACRSTVIPESVTAIGNYAYLGCVWLTDITIPSHIQSVAKDAFYGCSGLASVTILTPSVGSYFSGLKSIREVVLGEGVTTIGDYAFDKCTGLTTVNIPASVTSIGLYAFGNCQHLTAITFPAGLTTIGGAAFSGCKALAAINIPASVTSIGTQAFIACSGLQSITVEEGNSVYDSRNNCNALINSEENELMFGCVNTVIPNSVTAIGNDAFYDCSDITSVYLPASVEKIGTSAFVGCRLENVVTRNPQSMIYTGTLYPFSEQTLQHAMLYVPVGTWGEAVYGNGGWYLFYNIREMATTVREISASKAYTLMSADNYGYAVYDSGSDQVKMVRAFYGMDEADPNSYWQLVDADNGLCLYNVGAGKYATVTAEGHLTLSATPVPITMADGEQGVVINNVPAKQWSFVQNNKVATDIHSTSLTTARQTERSSAIYDLQGRRLKVKPEKGIYIQNGKKMK